SRIRTFQKRETFQPRSGHAPGDAAEVGGLAPMVGLAARPASPLLLALLDSHEPHADRVDDQGEEGENAGVYQQFVHFGKILLGFGSGATYNMTGPRRLPAPPSSASPPRPRQATAPRETVARGS